MEVLWAAGGGEGRVDDEIRGVRESMGPGGIRHEGIEVGVAA